MAVYTTPREKLVSGRKKRDFSKAVTRRILVFVKPWEHLPGLLPVRSTSSVLMTHEGFG